MQKFCHNSLKQTLEPRDWLQRRLNAGLFPCANEQIPLQLDIDTCHVGGGVLSDTRTENMASTDTTVASPCSSERDVLPEGS